MQPAAITFSPAEAAINYFHNSATLPPPTTIKKSCKEQFKMKFDIVLQQNCDQSVKVRWSIRSSAHWRIEEWCLTSNKSANSNKANLNDQVFSSNSWQENIFCNRAYRITNTTLDCRVYRMGVGQYGMHKTGVICCITAQ